MKALINASVLLALWGVSVSLGAEPRLLNAKRVFPEGNVRWKEPRQYSLWAMRLSPDGRNVLYARLKGKPPLTAKGEPDWQKAEYELLLRNLKTGKDTVLPIGPMGLNDRPWFPVGTVAPGPREFIIDLAATRVHDVDFYAHTQRFAVTTVAGTGVESGLEQGENVTTK